MPIVFVGSVRFYISMLNFKKLKTRFLGDFFDKLSKKKGINNFFYERKKVIGANLDSWSRITCLKMRFLVGQPFFNKTNPASRN